MNRIPLFPIRLVLYPGSKYVLHIFEDRYKQMISKIREGDSLFGISLQEDDNIALIGTIVRVLREFNHKENGEFDMVIEGIRRFEIAEYEVSNSGYLMCIPEPYEDIPGPPDQYLNSELKRSFEELLESINYEVEDSFWHIYEKAELKSFKIAEKSGMNLNQQQTFLQLREESQRIRFLLYHLSQLKEFISVQMKTNSIIINDGYLQEE